MTKNNFPHLGGAATVTMAQTLQSRIPYGQYAQRSRKHAETRLDETVINSMVACGFYQLHTRTLQYAQLLQSVGNQASHTTYWLTSPQLLQGQRQTCAYQPLTMENARWTQWNLWPSTLCHGCWWWWPFPERLRWALTGENVETCDNKWMVTHTVKVYCIIGTIPVVVLVGTEKSAF